MKFFLWGVAAWLGRWQELLFWLPAILVLLVFAFYAIPAADPRAGIDGFGSLWSTLLVLFNAALAGFFAWLCQHLYFRELTDDDEEALGDIAVGNVRARRRAAESEDEHASLPFAGLLDCDEKWRGRNALLVLLIDRLTWFGVWLPTFYALQGLLS